MCRTWKNVLHLEKGAILAKMCQTRNIALHLKKVQKCAASRKKPATLEKVR